MAHRNPIAESTGQLRVVRGGINVDAAVLVDDFLPFQSWRAATIEQRMEAVVAHEYAEHLSPGPTPTWRHAEALVRSYRNRDISPQAHAIIADQIRDAISSPAGQISDSIRTMLRDYAQRHGISLQS